MFTVCDYMVKVCLGLIQARGGNESEKDDRIMKVCASCQAENPDNAKFCRRCGTPLAKQEQDAPVADQSSDSAEQSQQPQLQHEATVQQSRQGIDPRINDELSGDSEAQTFADYSAQPFWHGQAAQPMQSRLQESMPGAAPGMASAQQNASTQANLFFNWLLAALKKPSLRMIKPAWYACLPILMEAIIVSLLVTIWASQAVSVVSHATSSLASMMDYPSPSASTGSSSSLALFIRGFIAMAVVLYAMVLIVFLGKKIYGDPDGLRQVHDAFGQIMIPAVLFHAVLLLLSLVGASLVAGIIFLLSFGLMAMIPSYLIATSSNHRKLDSFWLWIIFMVVAFLILLLMMIIVLGIAGTAFMSAMFSMF